MEIKEDYILISDKTLIEKLERVGATVVDGKLPLLEALYFSEKGLLENKEKIKKTAKKEEMADEKYLVLKDLRDKGYVARVSLRGNEYFRVGRKGMRVGEDRTAYVVKVVSPDWKTDVKGIRKMLEFSGKIRKSLVIAVVDDEKISYITMGRTRFD